MLWQLRRPDDPERVLQVAPVILQRTGVRPPGPRIQPRGYDELVIFRDLKPSIALGVGVIDIKDNEVETPQAVAAAIERAVRVLGPERVRWVHPDCGFWMLQRSVVDRKMRALVEGRDMFLGQDR